MAQRARSTAVAPGAAVGPSQTLSPVRRCVVHHSTRGEFGLACNVNTCRINTFSHRLGLQRPPRTATAQGRLARPPRAAAKSRKASGDPPTPGHPRHGLWRGTPHRPPIRLRGAPSGRQRAAGRHAHPPADPPVLGPLLHPRPHIRRSRRPRRCAWSVPLVPGGLAPAWCLCLCSLVAPRQCQLVFCLAAARLRPCRGPACRWWRSGPSPLWCIGVEWGGASASSGVTTTPSPRREWLPSLCPDRPPPCPLRHGQHGPCGDCPPSPLSVPGCVCRPAAAMPGSCCHPLPAGGGGGRVCVPRAATRRGTPGWSPVARRPRRPAHGSAGGEEKRRRHGCPR